MNATTLRRLTNTMLRGLLVIGLLGLVPFLAGTGPAQAAGGNTYPVNGATGGSPTCASAANNPALPFAKIKDALTCVNGDGTTAATPDTITIAAGTYDESRLLVNGNVNIEGQAGATTIDAQHLGQVMFTNQGVTVSIRGLTIKNGLGCSATGCNGFGGGINNGGTLTISNSALNGDIACNGTNCQGSGGGMYNQGTLSVTNTTLGGKASAAGNVACSGQGGGVYNDPNDPFFGSPNFAVTLTNDTITNNMAESGGGIFNKSGSPTLQNDTIKTNTPDNCAGPVSVTGCTG